MRNENIGNDLEEIYCREDMWNNLDDKVILLIGAYGMLASYVLYACVSTY